MFTQSESSLCIKTKGGISTWTHWCIWWFLAPPCTLYDKLSLTLRDRSVGETKRFLCVVTARQFLYNGFCMRLLHKSIGSAPWLQRAVIRKRPSNRGWTFPFPFSLVKGARHRWEDVTTVWLWSQASEQRVFTFFFLPTASYTHPSIRLGGMGMLNTENWFIIIFIFVVIIMK